jgi:hypothetical protein
MSRHLLPPRAGEHLRTVITHYCSSGRRHSQYNCAQARRSRRQSPKAIDEIQVLSRRAMATRGQAMKRVTLVQDHQDPLPAATAEATSALPWRIWAWIAGEIREALPATIFFFIGFNFIVLTTNLLVERYGVAVSSFMLATVAALVVGKAVITANTLPFLTRFDRSPLILPILFKTGIYWIAVFFARLAERFVHFILDGNSPFDFLPYLTSDFSWRRFAAISAWIFVLFLIFVTASEFTQLLGVREMRRLLFTYRPSELQLNKRQRARELMRLNRLADEYRLEDFRDPQTPAHRELVEIIERLARAESKVLRS